jgi:bromodomain and PHD finger-containing protein 1
LQVYRRGGEISGETDDDTQSGSATDVIATSEDDDDDSSDNSDDDDDSSSDDNSSATSSTRRIPLEPLDLVWAKCRGYPWYPALIINPKMPRTGYLHNGVPIPVPPQEVLDMANSHTSPHYLILFFDAKRTWQWLTRDKLEPLGVDSELDKAKLVQSKKPSEKKAVKKAYEDAILHRCRVTGENASVMSEEDESNA